MLAFSSVSLGLQRALARRTPTMPMQATVAAASSTAMPIAYFCSSADGVDGGGDDDDDGDDGSPITAAPTPPPAAPQVGGTLATAMTQKTRHQVVEPFVDCFVDLFVDCFVDRFSCGRTRS